MAKKVKPVVPPQQEPVYVILRAGITTAVFPFPLPLEKLDLTIDGLFAYAKSPEVRRTRDDEAILQEIQQIRYEGHGMTANGKAVRASEKIRGLIGTRSTQDDEGKTVEFQGLELVVARDESAGAYRL